jgi:heme-degrading monooxygenase HmoA
VRTLTAVDHRVADFDAWKKVYDGVREMQRAGGVRFQQVLRAPDEPNRIFVTHVFETREAAEAFYANSELKAALAEAGVDESSMKLHFFEEVESGEV